VTRDNDDDNNNNGNINNTENSFDESEWFSQCDRLTQKKRNLEVAGFLSQKIYKKIYTPKRKSKVSLARSR
jgi:hypothetical protein